MSSAQFPIPLIVQSPGNLIKSSEHNAEFVNIYTNLNPAGVGGFQDSTAQKQLVTDPASGLAASLADELRQIRYQIAELSDGSFWYSPPADSVVTLRTDITAIEGYVTDADLVKTSAPTANTLYNPNIPKAWALLTLGSSPTVTVTEGFNIDTATWSTSAITVNFHTDMADANYGVKPFFENVQDGVATHMLPESKAVGSFIIRLRAGINTSATQRNFQSGDIIFVEVMGKQ